MVANSNSYSDVNQHQILMVSGMTECWNIGKSQYTKSFQEF